MPRQTYKEIAFRQFFDILKTPSIAMLNYYQNLIRAFHYLFADQPDKIRYLEKEVRKIELAVGIVREPENVKKYRLYQQFKKEKLEPLQKEIDFLEKAFPFDNDKLFAKALKILENDYVELDKLNFKEYSLVMDIKPKMDLVTMEQYMQNSMNLKSFFKEDGKKITQLQIYSMLNNLVDWMNEQASKEMKKIRFTQPMR